MNNQACTGCDYYPLSSMEAEVGWCTQCAPECFEVIEGIARIDQIHHREDSIQNDAHMQAIARAEHEIMEMIGVEAVVTLGDQHAVYY